MDPANALQNATRAMQLAEDWLGIPQVSICYDFVCMKSSQYVTDSIVMLACVQT